MRNIGIV